MHEAEDLCTRKEASEGAAAARCVHAEPACAGTGVRASASASAGASASASASASCECDLRFEGR